MICISAQTACERQGKLINKRNTREKGSKNYILSNDYFGNKVY